MEKAMKCFLILIAALMLSFGQAKGQLNEVDTIWANEYEFVPGNFNGFAFNEERNQALVVLGTEIQFFNTVNGDSLYAFKDVYDYEIGKFDIPYNWKYMVSIEDGVTFRIVDLMDGSTKLLRDNVNDCAISNDGNIALIAVNKSGFGNWDKHWIVKYDLNTFEPIDSVFIGGKTYDSRIMEISPDGKYFCYEKYNKEYIPKEGKDRYTFQFYIADVESLENVKLLATEQAYGIIPMLIHQTHFYESKNALLFNTTSTFWDYDIDTKQKNYIPLTDLMIRGFSKDEKYVCTIFEDNYFHVYSMDTYEEVYVADFFGMSCYPTNDNKYLICFSGGKGAVCKIGAPWTMVGVEEGIEQDSNIYFENGIIHLSYSIEETQNLKMELYDLQGNKLQNLYEDYLQAGEHHFQFPVNLTSGMYFITIESNNGISAKKLMVVN